MVPRYLLQLLFCEKSQIAKNSTTTTRNSLEGLPSKYYQGPMLLNISVRMGTGVSNMVNLLTKINVFFHSFQCLYYSSFLELKQTV